MDPTVGKSIQEIERDNVGVLLYYKYVNLGDQKRGTVNDWYERVCRQEGLRGRIRVALDGVNCTLGGHIEALQRHITGVRAHDVIKGDDIDFKLSESRGPRNLQAALESGFTTLSVKAVKEVVSMGTRGKELSSTQSARHVSPQEFHRILKTEAVRQSHRERASRPKVDPVERCDCSTTSGATVCRDKALDGARSPIETPHVDDRQPEFGAKRPTPGSATAVAEHHGEHFTEERTTVLLDVRNVYETSIGHFSVEGVERLDPKTRQFSDLPAWVEENIHLLRGKRVLMYCTGGVRCEKASALIRRECAASAAAASSSSDDTELLQLAGGIERYLQAYPSKGPCDDSRNADGATNAKVLLGGSTRDAGVLHRAGEMETAGSTASIELLKAFGAEASGERKERGFFHGKNFVFDERVSVPERPAGGVVVGRCVCCERPWDDYGSRSRCSRCRMLVLVCDACVQIRTSRKSQSLVHPSSPLANMQGAESVDLRCVQSAVTESVRRDEVDPGVSLENSYAAAFGPSASPPSLRPTVAPSAIPCASCDFARADLKATIDDEGSRTVTIGETALPSTSKTHGTSFPVASSVDRSNLSKAADPPRGSSTVTISEETAADNARAEGQLDDDNKRFCSRIKNPENGEVEHWRSKAASAHPDLVCSSCRGRSRRGHSPVLEGTIAYVAR